MRNEIWHNGELIEVIETEDEIEIPETPVTVTPSAIDELKDTLTDPSTNSIAKIKTALVGFCEKLRGEQ